MKVKLALVLNPPTEENLRRARQIGVTDIVGNLRPDGHGPVWELLPLLRLKSRVEDAGLRLTVLEGAPPMEKIKLGLPERDEEIENFCRSLRNVGAAGIPIVCYNFMVGSGWMRTSTSARTRGGARSTSFDYSLIKDALPTRLGVFTDGQVWENYAYFIERVLPVAEEAGVKLALHPDDPPLSPIMGIARIFRDVEAFDRALEIGRSDYHGLTFCQGCFAEMGVDIPQTIRYFGERKKIFFVHFRNLRGTAEKFQETFHDDGDTNMFAAMRAYHEVGFDGPMRPDHVPEMEGDPSDRPGYTIQGRLFAVGYMKGLMDAVDATA